MRLRFKIGLIALVAFIVFLAPAWFTPQNAVSEVPFLDCGSAVTPEEAAAFKARWANEPPMLAPPVVPASMCVPIAAHIVRTDEGTGGLPMSQLDQAMLDANAYYANTGISYYVLSVDYIDDDDYYYNINTNAEIAALKGENVVADAINIYFTPNLSNENGGLCGISSFTTNPVQGIAMANGCTGVSSNPSSFPHEIGHYFDLYHTHETAFGDELVDGSNCGTTGDLLCDTPADPTLRTSGGSQNIGADCVYYGTETDGNGDSYTPDTSQLMSYAPKACRTTISPQGEARALSTLLVLRPNLLTRGCPPEADAGQDKTVECASPTTTDVTLDGTGSSDPEGVSLSFVWVATGVTFDDATSATPTGGFSFGQTMVVLTVSDGALTDSDTMYVDVVDTTAPSITCAPADTVECVGFCGVPKDDAQLTAFFAGVSASDVCCGGDVTITNDAPDCFPMGTTDVIFTATDCNGNAAACTTSVTVEDTTPPEITVTLDRDRLWPPNHKMADIGATVVATDICCEFPTFVLTSITSNEPDNGKGDGNTVDDIQAANFGADDTSFQLRSERSGKGDGRIYSIVYTASDCVGNTASDTVEVHVPHDQSGFACASSGFETTGLGFDPALDKFVLIVPSRQQSDDGVQAFDATTLDVSRMYVGNVKGVTTPIEHKLIDNNVDGMMDLAVYYSAQAVNLILDDSTPTTDGSVAIDENYGAIGLHYVGADGTDYLVPNIFELGEPVPLVPTVTLGRTGGLGGGTPGDRDADTPTVTALGEAYPNPFNPTTTVPFTLLTSETVTLRIYDATGKLVRTLKNESMPAGVHQAVWDGRDDVGSQAATGVYFVRLVAGSQQMTKKVVMLK